MIEFRSAAHDKKTVDNINQALKLQELVKERMKYIEIIYDTLLPESDEYKILQTLHIESLVEESERITSGGDGSS